MSKNSTGFTIVELLIVIVVIAILAAITIVSYNGITAQASDTATKTGIVSVAKELTLESSINAGAPCYSDWQEIDLSCMNTSQMFAALPVNSIAQDDADAIRYYETNSTPTLAAKSASGAYFIVKDGILEEITAAEYLSTSAASNCGATATYSSLTNAWTQVSHYC